MGRAKLKMELIGNEKLRKIMFKKRKQAVLTKVEELTTLCDVDACMIIYHPKQEECNFAEPEIFPKDPNEVKRIIGVYKAKSKDSLFKKNYARTKIFQESKNKVEEELAMMRKKNLEAHYPFQLDNLVNEAGCLHYHDVLSKKAESARVLLNRLKMKNMPQTGGFDNVNNNNNVMDFAHARSGHNFAHARTIQATGVMNNNMMNNMPRSGGFDTINNNNTVMDLAHSRTGQNLYGMSGFTQSMGVMNNLPPIQFPATEHYHQNQDMHLSPKSSMMRLLLTGNEYHVSGLSNGLYQQQAVFLESAAGLDPRVVYPDKRTMARYYAAAQTTPYMLFQPPQCMQYVPNHHFVNGGGNNEEQNIVQHQMNNSMARFHYG